MTIKDIKNLHTKYAPNKKVFELVYGHCQVVCEIALWCSNNISKEVQVDNYVLQTASLLHDIGTYVFFDQTGHIDNERLYPLHAILGSKILQDEGLDKEIYKIVETHVLLGLTKQEIKDRPWIIPAKDYLPGTIEGQLLCYADRFHSKHPTFNDYDTFLNRLKKDLPLQADKFESLSNRFGIPDIAALADKYNQSIR